MRLRIALLALASGMCGIAYELLYARLLTTYFGDMFHVAAAILATFLLGISLGSLIAHRWLRWLFAIEIAIGGYAAATAFAFGAFGRELQTAWLPHTSGNPFATAALVFALLVVPAVLIGFSVPLFALLLRLHASGSSRDGTFRAVYSLYNLGAAACVLAVEFVVLRTLGLRGALLALSAVNFGSGLCLWRIPVDAAAGELSAGAGGASGASVVAGPLHPATLPLFGASVVSGVYQMFLYKLAEMIFGPFHENFALVLALALVGIASGTAWAARRGVGLGRWLIEGSLLVSATLLAIAPLTVLWALLNGWLGVVPALSGILKLLLLALMSAAPFAVFGGTLAALLGELPDSREQAGRILAISGVGNCVGYLLMVFWLYAVASDAVIACCIAGGTLGCGIAAVRSQGGRIPTRAVLSGAALAALLALAWPSRFLHYGFDSYVSWPELKRAQALFSGLQVYRRFDSQISLLDDASGAEVVIINGYTSLVSSADGRTNLRELLYGLTPALYSQRRERALVLGVGTGITAAATASAYAHTTAVEVNPSMLDLLPHFAAHNFDLVRNPRASLVLDDGLAALLRSGERYDAIVNTVTSPLYFSSSKLYTKDFFSLVSEHLAPGGVYTLWFDGRVTETGARVIFETLAASFDDCAVVFLNTTYLQLVCANEPLHPRDPTSVAWDPNVRERIDAHDLGLDLEDLLAALQLTEHHLFARDWNASLNTFDRPVLEFLMAGRALAHQDWWSPYALLAVDLSASPRREGPLGARALARRCHALRMLGYVKIGACLDGLAKTQDGREGLALYAQLLAPRERRAQPRVQIGEHLELGRRLLAAGDVAEAAALLQGIVVPPRSRGDLLALEARIRLAQGGTLDDAEISQLFTAAPLDPEARAAIAEALRRRGEPALALAHARVLPRLGPLTPNARELLETLEREVGPRVVSSR